MRHALAITVGVCLVIAISFRVGDLTNIVSEDIDKIQTKTSKTTQPARNSALAVKDSVCTGSGCRDIPSCIREHFPAESWKNAHTVSQQIIARELTREQAIEKGSEAGIDTTYASVMFRYQSLMCTVQGFAGPENMSRIQRAGETFPNHKNAVAACQRKMPKSAVGGCQKYIACIERHYSYQEYLVYTLGDHATFKPCSIT